MKSAPLGTLVHDFNEAVSALWRFSNSETCRRLAMHPLAAVPKKIRAEHERLCRAVARARVRVSKASAS